MNTENYVYRREVASKISGLNLNQLSYLDKVKLVIPYKEGNNNRPTCYYSFDQIVELKIIKKLRENASWYRLKEAKQYLIDVEDRESFIDKILISANNKIYLIKSELGALENLLIQISGKNQGQIILESILHITDVVDEINKDIDKLVAEVKQPVIKNNIINFADKVKDILQKRKKVA